MSNGPADPRWPRLLGLAVHEFRTPVTVVNGYLRMLLKDRAGPLSDQQRRLLEEAEKSCGRLSGLIAEMSDLANLEAGAASMNRGTVDLRALLAGVIASLPEMPDRSVSVEFEPADGPAAISGDEVRLRSAFTSVIVSLRRELVHFDRLVVRERLQSGPAVSHVIAIGDPERIGRLIDAGADDLVVFDEWRGGCGLSLAIARRVLAAHGASIWSPADDGKAGALIQMPRVA